DRKVSLNEEVGPPRSAQLFTLAADLAVVHVEAQVAEGDLAKVRAGLEAEFTVPPYSDSDVRFRGKVTDVRPLPAGERGAVFYKVLIETASERDPGTGRWRLTPGLTANVDIVRRRHARAWKVPAMALSFQPDEASISGPAREKLRQWPSVKDA